MVNRTACAAYELRLLLSAGAQNESLQSMFSNFPLSYVEPIYRPPAEAQSLLIQLTIGCSHNSCSFCAMYRNKRFRVRSFAEIADDLQKAAAYARGFDTAPRRIFLCDGDALAAPQDLLIRVLDRIAELLPSVTRIGIYASARNILSKSEAELTALAAKKLKIAYIGAESGSDQVLSLINKGNTAAEIESACLKIKQAGWKLSQIFMLGVGGMHLSSAHCEGSARLASATAPNYLSFLTTVAVPGTPYSALIERQQLEPLSIRDLLKEMHAIIGAIQPATGNIIFRANHVSNLFPLEGTLPRDQQRLLAQLDGWIRECPPGVYPTNDPSLL